MENTGEIDSREDEVLDKIREIVKESSDGEYAYRGQSGTIRSESGDPLPYQVTSTLYRAMAEICPEIKDAKWLNVNLVQKEALEVARKFASEEFASEGYDNKRMLSRIQHHAGDTNLIDFTKDYLVALFFACSHKYGEKDGEDGKVFLLEISELKAKEKAREKNKEIDGEIEMITPDHPPNRVIGQKSVFIQSRTGIIHKNMNGVTMNIVLIPRDLKQSILRYLETRHDISLYTIYNDLHGYIRNRKEHGNVVMEFYVGLSYSDKSKNAQSPEEKRDALEEAIKHYNKVIHLDPEYVAAYNNRGLAKSNCGNIKKESDGSGATIDYKDAIRDYDKAIELDPKYVKAYSNRGLAKSNCGNIKKELDESGATIDYKDAIRDYDKAIELDTKHAKIYYNRGITKVDSGDIKEESGDESGTIIDYKDAIKDYDKAIELDAEYMNAYFNRGLAKERLGGRDNLQQALSDFEKAKELALQQKKESMVGKAQAGIERVTAKIAKMPES